MSNAFAPSKKFTQAELETAILERLRRFHSLEHVELFNHTVCNAGNYSYANEHSFNDAVESLRASNKVLGSKWEPYTLAKSVTPTPAVASPSPKLFGGRKAKVVK